MSYSIGIIGSGAWGTTLGLTFSKAGIPVTLWEHNPERAEMIARNRENRSFLPGFQLPELLKITSSIKNAVEEKDVVILAVPSQQFRQNAALMKPSIDKNTILVSASKGLEISSLQRISQILEEELPEMKANIAALSGPNISREIAEGKPAAAVLAAETTQAAEQAQQILSTSTYRIYRSDDLVGVELAGALKNIMAIGAGICDGLGFGENTKASFLTRGLSEITRLGVAAGANPLTFAGLAGLGDLIATCSSTLSRNHRVGISLAQGKNLDDILSELHAVAEGVATTRAALEMARKLNIELPITEQVYAALFEQKSPQQAVADLMLRELKHELEGIE